MAEIKEIKELVAGVEVMAVAAKEITKDGELSISDVEPAIEALKKYQVIVEAVKGADQIPAELKDLTLDEMQAIAQLVLDLVAKLKGA